MRRLMSAGYPFSELRFVVEGFNEDGHELQVVITHEGIVMDIIEEGEVIASSWEMMEDIDLRIRGE